jgi:hypothetical protein
MKMLEPSRSRIGHRKGEGIIAGIGWGLRDRCQ